MREMLREIAVVCTEALRANRARIAHVCARVVIIVAIALAAEALLFNFRYFTTADNHPINLSSQMEGQLPTDEDGRFLFTVADKSVTFENVNKQVDNIVVALSADQPAQAVPLRVHFSDSAHSTYFDGNDYATGVPEFTVVTNLERSRYVTLETTGLVGTLRVEVSGDDVVFPVKVDAIYLNGRYPFEFNAMRFFLLAGILALLYAFRPRSSLYRWGIRERTGAARRLVCAAVAVELAVMAAAMLYATNLVGVATGHYNAGSWDGRSLVNSFEVGGDNAQQYAELAKSLADGRLDLEIDPPAWLAGLDDPYDKGARDEAAKLTGEECLWDTAYYGGRYYVYFGVVPCLVFYLPFYLATGANFPTAAGVLLACWAFAVGLTALLWRFSTRHFRKVSPGLFLLLQIPLVFCCGVLYLLKFPTFYSLPIACGLAFSVWGLLFWMVGRASSRPGGWYLAGSLCMALVMGCRPQLVVLSLVAFPLFWRRYITERRLFSPEGARELACLLAPYALVFAAIGWYNAARFGSALDFGANYNLTMNDMTQRGFSLARLAPALFAYLLQPPNVSGVFPFLQPVGFSTTYAGQTIREVTFGGIFACLPLLWALFFTGRVLKMRIRDRKTHTAAGAVILMLALGILLCCLDAEAAGILQRYFADFSFLFLTSAVLVVLVANEYVDAGKGVLALQRVLVVLVGFSLLHPWLMYLVPETGWISSAYPWAYQSLLQAFLFWT